MNYEAIGLIIGVLSLFVGLISLLLFLKGGPKKMRKINPGERLKLIEKILYQKHSYVLNLKTSAFIFTPTGTIQFGAAWANGTWLDLLGAFLSENTQYKTTVATAGNHFYLTDLITGENIRIPLDPQNEMTLDQNGISIGHMYIFTEY